MVELLSILGDLAFELLMQWEKRRQEDPKFAIAANVLFSKWSASSTTDERKKALDDLAALIKS